MDDLTAMQANGPQIRLTIDYKKNPDPGQIGRLLIAISDDYLKISGGQSLAITSIKSGSVTIWLGAAILAAVPYVKAAKELAVAGKAIVEFGKLVGGLFKKAKSDPGSIPLFSGRKTAGLKTLERMVEITAECGGEFQFEQTGGGTSTKFTMKARDAKKIAKASKEKGNGQKLLAKTAKSLPATVGVMLPNSEFTPSKESAKRMLSFIGNLSKQSSAEELSELPESDLSALFKILVQVHQQTGSSYMLDNLALQLSQHGHEHLSQLLRAEMIKVRSPATQMIIRSGDDA